MRTGFDPTQETLVAGAVRLGSYDYFQSQIVRHVALKGHDVELQMAYGSSPIATLLLAQLLLFWTREAHEILWFSLNQFISVG